MFLSSAIPISLLLLLLLLLLLSLLLLHTYTLYHPSLRQGSDSLSTFFHAVKSFVLASFYDEIKPGVRVASLPLLSATGEQLSRKIGMEMH